MTDSFEIDALFDSDPSLWLTTLPEYQQNLVKQVLAQTPSPEAAAARWLSVAPQNTSPLGATKGQQVFLEKLWDELEAFLCGDEKYESDRMKLLAESKPLHAYVVGAISVAIAPTLGSSAAFLAPVVALLLMSMGKITLNAWCATRRAGTSA